MTELKAFQKWVQAQEPDGAKYAALARRLVAFSQATGQKWNDPLTQRVYRTNMCVQQDNAVMQDKLRHAVAERNEAVAATDCIRGRVDELESELSGHRGWKRDLENHISDLESERQDLIAFEGIDSPVTAIEAATFHSARATKADIDLVRAKLKIEGMASVIGELRAGQPLGPVVGANTIVEQEKELQHLRGRLVKLRDSGECPACNGQLESVSNVGYDVELAYDGEFGGKRTRR